jgi:uncharacterized phage protein gp47/JayE
MSFSRPSLLDLINRTRDDIVSRLPNADLLRRADGEVYARILAGASHALYGYIDWLSRQLIYDTAEIEMLERWASIWGITRKPASAATGTITFTGTSGITVPSGTQLSAYDGQLYATIANVTLASGVAVATVNAVTAGAAGNRTTGQTLNLQTPIAGVNAGAAAGTLSGGADIETDDALRGRLLARIKQPPHGGAKHDYAAWALEISGVTRAWVYGNELGAGTVTVRFVRDLDASIIPDAGEVAAVQAYIDNLRPVTAAVTVVAPVAVPLNFTITVTPNTTAVKDAVTAELASLISKEAEPGGTLYLSHIRAAISAASGENNYVMTAPSADVVNTTGNITTMGTITWV